MRKRSESRHDCLRCTNRKCSGSVIVQAGAPRSQARLHTIKTYYVRSKEFTLDQLLKPCQHRVHAQHTRTCGPRPAEVDGRRR